MTKPDKPGPWWWRLQPDHAWLIVNVYGENSGKFEAMDEDGTWYPVESWDGQWAPCPTPDEFKEGYGVAGPAGVVGIGLTEMGAWSDAEEGTMTVMEREVE